MNQEIIELLEKVEWGELVGVNRACYICHGIKPTHYCHCALNQALTLLKQQPPAGEFTKKMRQANCYAIENKSCVYSGDLVKALDRLDSAEARLKDLLEACNAYIRHCELHDSSDHPKANMFCTECPRYRKGIEAAIAKAKKVGE